MRGNRYYFIQLMTLAAVMIFSNLSYSQHLIKTFSEGINGQFGGRISEAGDINNDGYSDIIVGAAQYNSGTGRVYIFFGGNHIDSIPDVVLNGDSLDNNFGCSVSYAGDVNKDGYDDIIIGAKGYNSNTGRAYIFFGGSTVDTIPDVILNGEGTFNYFGNAVSYAGDINKDGYGDVIVGASKDPNGAIYVYYGGNPMDANADLKIYGPPISTFGNSVSGVGDVNKDGFDDFIVGSKDFFDHGSAYIFYGGSSPDTTADVVLVGEGSFNSFGVSVAAAGDVNKDGYADVLVGSDGYYNGTGRAYIYFGGSPMDSIPDVVLTGKEAGYSLGYSVAGGGDVNKDGYDDVIVGAYGSNSDAGSAYIYYGGSNMDSTADIDLYGEAAMNNFFGSSVSIAGDVNKDGYDDIIVGAYGYNNYTGKVYLFSDSTSITSVDKNLPSLPSTIRLEQNYPNPFNPTTNIGFRISDFGFVSLKVYDILGNEVATLVNEEKSAGDYKVKFDASSLSSGIYFYKLNAGSYTEVKKMQLLK